MKSWVKMTLVAVLMTAWTCVGAEKVANIHFLVVKGSNGKPVRNASIVLHGVDKHGWQKSTCEELKTDEDGKTKIEAVPYGKWRIQVLAPHFRTYGEDYQINQPMQEITIKLEEPKDQYSIYK